MKFSSTGSEDIYLGVPSNLRSSTALFQVETPLPWSGSLIPMRIVAGGVTKIPTAFTRLSDATFLSGSIGTSGSFSGSFLVETLGGDVFLRHTWVVGSVDIYAQVLPD
jgi:hypothetical protein